MATFKELTANDFKTRRTFLDQIVDVIQEDISGSATRQHYQVFVTGGVGPGVTSSLFQTVYDQPFVAQTANAVFDITFGLYEDSTIVSDASTGQDVNGKLLFPSQSLMMREKVFMYKQHAQKLLGDSDAQFSAPFGSSTATDLMDAALFIDFKRLFHRDQMKRETFVMGFYETGSLAEKSTLDVTGSNIYFLNDSDVSGFKIYTDIGAASNKIVTFGGQVSDLVDASNTSRTVGLVFNDAGIVVLDMEKVFDVNQVMTGVIDAIDASTGPDWAAGQTLMSGAFIPDFVVSASMDDVIDHIAVQRFGSGTLSAMVFENITNINSTLIYTRLAADEFNYSSNPTYVNTDDRIVVIDEGQEETQRAFTMITTIGFYDANDTLLAVAKLSRPVEKNDERDLTFTTRLDF